MMWGTYSSGMLYSRHHRVFGSEHSSKKEKVLFESKFDSNGLKSKGLESYGLSTEEYDVYLTEIYGLFQEAQKMFEGEHFNVRSPIVRVLAELLKYGDITITGSRTLPNEVDALDRDWDIFLRSYTENITLDLPDGFVATQLAEDDPVTALRHTEDPGNLKVHLKHKEDDRLGMSTTRYAHIADIMLLNECLSHPIATTKMLPYTVRGIPEIRIEFRKFEEPTLYIIGDEKGFDQAEIINRALHSQDDYMIQFNDEFRANADLITWH
jgi:hypothetical protein